MTPTKDELDKVFSEAERLYSPVEVNQAIEQMAKEITLSLDQKNPVILCLMTGAVVPFGLLLPKLQFPLEVDYMHVTRYLGKTRGDDIKWLKYPEMDLQGRTVLLVDDILDEGHTLAAAVEECKNRGAEKVLSCVLIDKKLNRPRIFEKADFTGLHIPDRYVFGYGMDYKGYLRNSPGIFAVKET